MQLRDVIAVNVRRARDTLDETQMNIALQAQVDLKTYRQIEHGRGNPTLDSLEQIAVALGLDPLALFVIPQDQGLKQPKD